MSVMGVIATDLVLNWEQTLDDGFEHSTGEWSISPPVDGRYRPKVSLYHNTTDRSEFVMETDLHTAVYFVMRREGEFG